MTSLNKKIINFIKFCKKILDFIMRGGNMEKRGIDISYYQGEINFEKIKQEVDFVIIRCGYGGNLVEQDDKNFKEYADACTRLKIPFGVYLYSYAVTEEQALSEALHTLRLISPYQLEYPVYLDVESKVQSGLSAEELADVVTTYCSRMEEAGYYVGIYANLNWFKTRLTSPKLDVYDKWLAQWNSAPTYQEPFGMWQYTSTGTLEGINGWVDQNIAYKDYPTLIRERGLNHLEKEPEKTLKFKVGDTVLLNGYLYVDSYGNGRGKKETNLIASITLVNQNGDATKPYNLNHGLGWVSEEDLVLYENTNDLSIGDTVLILLPGRASKDGSGKVALGIGWKRKVLDYDPNALYPYRIGNDTGTTGYYKRNALRKK